MGPFKNSKLGFTSGVALSAFGLVGLLLSGCGSSEEADSSNKNLNAIPVFVMASVVGSGSPSSEARAGGASSKLGKSRKNNASFAPLDLSLGQVPQAFSSAARSSATEEETTESSALGSWETEIANLATILTATDSTQCFSGVSFSVTPPTVSCYGPQLVVIDYPGTTATFGTTNPSCPITADDETPGNDSIGDGCLPSGDVGIFTDNESGEACSAAKMNALLSDVGNIVNNALKINAGVVCTMGLEGRGKLDKGGSYNAKALINSQITGSALTEAILRRADDDASGNEVYYTTITGAFPLSGSEETISVSLNVVTKNRADGSGSTGRVYGYFDQELLEVRKGFSITYNVNRDTVAFDMKPAITGTSADASDLFSETGEYQFDYFTGGTVDVAKSNAQYLVSSLNTKSGEGSLLYAWQAGASDANARVFQAQVAVADSTLSGFSYFGFGPNFSSESLGTIDGMVCNWTPPSGGSARATVSGKAQAQTFSFDAETGVFTLDSTHNRIFPTSTCSASGVAGTYRVGVFTSASEAENSTAPALTAHDLATYNDTSIGTFTAPTAPTLE